MPGPICACCRDRLVRQLRAAVDVLADPKSDELARPAAEAAISAAAQLADLPLGQEGQ